MKAMPVLGGRYFNNCIIASKPPAEAPMATMGKWPRDAGRDPDMADFDLLFFIVVQALTWFRKLNNILGRYFNL